MLFAPETIPINSNLHTDKTRAATNEQSGAIQPKQKSMKHKSETQKIQRSINPEQQKIIDFLEENASSHINRELAEMLNERGFFRSNGKPFDGLFLNHFMRSNGIKTLKQRYIEAGWLELGDAADRLGILPIVLRIRAEKGIFTGSYIIADGNNAMLFDPNTLTS